MLRKEPQNSDRDEPESVSSRSGWVTLLFAIVILTPSMIGFVMKFTEFVHTFQGDTQGAFAITPMVNYLLASAGFLCLLLWAGMNGAFWDMEAPKHTMLARELQLDEQQQTGANPHA
jgi:nitrogen fixation-related uncharacterized protein